MQISLTSLRIFPLLAKLPCENDWGAMSASLSLPLSWPEWLVLLPLPKVQHCRYLMSQNVVHRGDAVLHGKLV